MAKKKKKNEIRVVKELEHPDGSLTLTMTMTTGTMRALAGLGVVTAITQGANRVVSEDQAKRGKDAMAFLEEMAGYFQQKQVNTKEDAEYWAAGHNAVLCTHTIELLKELLKNS